MDTFNPVDRLFPKYLAYTVLPVLLLCSCIDKTDLPFDADTASIALPEELLGNWMTEFSHDNLIVTEDSITWQGNQYAIINAHPLVKVFRAVAAAGRDTIALYAKNIKTNTAFAALYQGTSNPLTESGELQPGIGTQFIRWWYPLGEKYPLAGTSWTYLLYYSYERGREGRFSSSTRYLGKTTLQVLATNPGDLESEIKLRKIIVMDTLYLKNHTTNSLNSRLWPNIYRDLDLDSLKTDFEYESEDYYLYYRDDSLFIAQDSADLFVSPTRIIQGSRVYMQPFFVNNESFLTGRDIKFERGKGITELDYSYYYADISLEFHDAQLRLLEFLPGG